MIPFEFRSDSLDELVEWAKDIRKKKSLPPNPKGYAPNVTEEEVIISNRILNGIRRLNRAISKNDTANIVWEAYRLGQERQLWDALYAP